MATTITTTTTHTCDLCKKEYPCEALRRLRLIQITEDNEPPLVEPSADVCADCRINSKIAELVTLLEEIRTRELFRRGRELGREENG